MEQRVVEKIFVPIFVAKHKLAKGFSSSHRLWNISGQEGPRLPRSAHNARMAKTKVFGEFGRVKTLPPRLVIK